jgi:hypothetical protein
MKNSFFFFFRGWWGFSDHQNLKFSIKIAIFNTKFPVDCQWYRKMLNIFHSQIWLNCLFWWLSSKPYITNLEIKVRLLFIIIIIILWSLWKGGCHGFTFPIGSWTVSLDLYPLVCLGSRIVSSTFDICPLVFRVHGLLVPLFDIYPLVFWVRGLLFSTFDVYPLVFWVRGLLVWTFDVYPLVLWVHGWLVWTFDVYPLVIWVRGLLVWTFDIYPLVFWVHGMNC